MKKVKTFVLALLIGLLLCSTAYAERTYQKWTVHNFDNYYSHLSLFAKGTFSDLISKNEPLSVKIIVSKTSKSRSNVTIGLFEYGEHESSSFRGLLMMKNSSGNILKIKFPNKWIGKFYPRRSKIPASIQEAIINFLRESVGKVKVVIQDIQGPIYRFSINANGFTAAYNKLNIITWESIVNTKKPSIK